ncbi:hypothetical protein COMA2_270016 [Candidatus Nitrospira nitrificans]|uniref:Uncharacterized protein n=1 Tax=Candidatus Nitrospira nitrificans TaxID=1742973 RepID=A0A0S4LGV7_9BACT|nr:hypothetical protein COMA2_270016 [Candidatus Nitrospira nitrificans]
METRFQTMIPVERLTKTLTKQLAKNLVRRSLNRRNRGKGWLPALPLS